MILHLLILTSLFEHRPIQLAQLKPFGEWSAEGVSLPHAFAAVLDPPNIAVVFHELFKFSYRVCLFLCECASPMEPKGMCAEQLA
jgi:hypothetical protein